jgi:hypothetical protein
MTEFTVHVRDRAFPPRLLNPTDVCIEPGQRFGTPIIVQALDLPMIHLSMGSLPSWGSFTDFGGGNGSLLLEPGPEEPLTSFSVDIYLNRGAPEEEHWTVPVSLTGYDQCGVFGTPFASGDVPVVHSGGPYSGVAGLPVTFLESSNPPADSSSLRWSFGDGHGALGARVNHVFAEGGVYQAIVRASQYYQSRDTTTVTIASAYPASARMMPEPHALNLALSRENLRIAIASSGDDYQISSLDPSTVCLLVQRNEKADSIFTLTTEEESGGTTEYQVSFANEAVARLLSGIRGKTTVEGIVQFRLRNGARVRAPLSLSVVGGPDRSNRVTVWPNPMNPAGVISFKTSAAGRVRLRIYEASGRLIRTLLDEARPEGFVDVRFDGLGRGGAPLASGVYYYEVETVDGRRNGRLTILR